MNDAFARADDFGVLEDEDGSADETSGNDDSDSDDDGMLMSTLCTSFLIPYL